jgi:hypothetical protein
MNSASSVLPQRPNSHVVGDKAVEILIAACDPAWAIAPVSKDYGLDLRVEVTRGGYITGEEFAVQVKGRASVRVKGDLLPLAKVRQATVNYWLAKLTPIMIAVVDTSTGNIYYDWLEYCYPGYPNAGQIDGEVALPLRHNANEHDLRKEVVAYVANYYASISSEMERLSKGIYLANLLFSISALHRLATNTAIELQRIEPSEPEELKKLLDGFCFTFASHDNLMSGLRAGAFGHLPERSRFFQMVEAKLQSYDEVRSKFLVYRGETDQGDLMVQPKYNEISAWLLPTIHILEDIQEILGLAQVTNRALAKPAHL